MRHYINLAESISQFRSIARIVQFQVLLPVFMSVILCKFKSMYVCCLAKWRCWQKKLQITRQLQIGAPSFSHIPALLSRRPMHLWWVCKSFSFYCKFDYIVPLLIYFHFFAHVNFSYVNARHTHAHRYREETLANTCAHHRNWGRTKKIVICYLYHRHKNVWRCF